MATARAIERAIRRMLAWRLGEQSESLIAVSLETRIPKQRLAIIARAHGIHYRGQHATPHQIRAAIRAVERDGLSCLAAAAEVGISKSSVHRFVQRKRNRLVDAAGSVRVVQHEWRCPTHGRITVWPCVACLALQRSRGTQGFQRGD